MNDPVIVFEAVVKRYRDVTALDGLSFSVPKTGCLGLLGPNGAGKTTAIKSLLGLTRIDGGKIINRSGHIGYLPQQPAAFGWMTAEEFLQFIGTAAGLSGNQLADRIAHWLAKLDLEKAQKRRISGFSGGMKQRLGLAGVLLQDPDVVVLDEPISALDPIGRHDILNLVAELKREKCVLMSTHILSDVDRVCDEVVIMRQGKALLQQRMNDLQADISSHYELDLAGKNDAIDQVASLLIAKEWVGTCTQVGATFEIRLRHGDSSVPTLLQWLSTLTDVQVVRFEKMTASLEDVFLQVVNGRS